MAVGVIGLGNIGGAIAANLVADGESVHVHDADAARVEALVSAGATSAEGPAALGATCEITFASLPSPEAVTEVAEDWLRGASPGRILVDLSTNSPQAVMDLGARLRGEGCHLLESPLTGGAPGAQARKLVFMVGGDPEVFERCRPLLDRLGRASFHLGELGRGSVAKLVNSLLAFASTWVSLEGLALAAAAGIDLRQMVNVVRTGGASNFYMDRMVEGIGQRDRPPRFAMALATKDARLIVDTSLRLGVPAPVAGQMAQVFVSACRAGLAERDWSELAAFMEHQADVKLALPPEEDGR